MGQVSHTREIMTQITLDDDLKARLEGLKQTVEVRDEIGRTVGQFVPQDEYMKLLYAWAKTAVTDEELEEARRSGPGRKLSEILKDLGAK
jgi:hypothetical protein